MSVEFEKSANSIIKVEMSEYRGQTNVNVREWTKYGGSDEFRPTKSGFTIPPEKWAEFVDRLGEFVVIKTPTKKSSAKGFSGTHYFLIKPIKGRYRKETILPVMQKMFDARKSSADQPYVERNTDLYKGKVENGVVVQFKRVE